jgi:hypothetical protein
MTDIKAAAAQSQAPPLTPGSFFRVSAKSHFAHGEIHQAKRIQREKLRGGAGELDLGVMVEFIIEDYFGRPCHHRARRRAWERSPSIPGVSRRANQASCERDHELPGERITAAGATAAEIKAIFAAKWIVLVTLDQVV